MCIARRRGRSAAAPPAEMQRRSRRRRTDPTSQVQPTDSYRLDAKHAEALKSSIRIRIPPTLLCYRFCPWLDARRVALVIQKEACSISF